MPTLAWKERNDLAQKFAPHLVLFPENQTLGRPGNDAKITGDYHPRDMQLLLERGILSAETLPSRQPATLDKLVLCTDLNAQLLVLGKRLTDRALAWQTYFEILDAGRARFPATTYARVQTRGEANAAIARATDLGKNASLFPDEVGRPFFKPEHASLDDLAIQYWFCYYFDDWANQHEGDWEGICIFLRLDGSDYRAVGASYYAHETGKRRHWAEVERAADTHPLVYVAAGSHASYFQHIDAGYMTTIPGFIIPFIGVRLNINYTTTRFDRVPNRRDFEPIKPVVELLPDPVGPFNANDAAWEHKKWLAFPGAWGVRVLGKLGHAGPLGPSHKGLKWHNPFAWMERYCTPDFLVY